MVEHWIGLANLPAQGREFSFDDQNVWRELWKEFGYDMDIVTPLAARVGIIPQPDGYLIQGHLGGAVTTVCHRCLEEAVVVIDHDFDGFEAHEDVDLAEGEPNHLRNVDTGWELDLAGLLWEEFLLALPEKILCADTCLGLCPQCGKNRNQEPCACSNPDSQSPLARALQGLKIKTN
ncbi:MAG: DUF177 domain-containing protein [Desulfomicrobium sp.]